MNMGMLTFARPAWLLALLPLAFFAWRWWRSPGAATRWQRVVDAHLLPHLLIGGGVDGKLPWLGLFIGWLCAILALAGPQLPLAQAQHAVQRSAFYVLVVDLSPAAAPQLERTKATLHALLRTLDGAPTALLVYAEEPYLVVPPTTDTDVLARFIPELAVDAIPAAGHRPERALRMAMTILQRNDAAARNIVWVSSAGRRAAPLPELNDVRLFALHGGEQDDPLLRAAAERTGGTLQAMRNDGADLQQLAAAIATATQQTAPRPSATGADIGYWLLLPLLPLAALRFRRGLLACLPWLLGATLLAPPAEAARLADLQARRLFAQGKHAQAASRFADTRWRALAHYRAGQFAEAARLLEGDNDPDALYNRGNALAKLGALEEALIAYEASLRVRPGDADTVYNRDLLRSLLNGDSNGGAAGSAAQSERDAARVAEQWLRSVPDDPGTLLRRKLDMEHRRRAAGKAERPW